MIGKRKPYFVARVGRTSQWGLCDGHSRLFVDWPLFDSRDAAEAECADWNSGDDDDYDPGPSEALWQARMGGDLSA